MSDTKKPFLPPEVLAWLRVAAIIAAFKFLGVDASTIKSVTSQLSGSAAVAEQASESVSITASNLESIVTTALIRQDEERREPAGHHHGHQDRFAGDQEPRAKP